MTNGELANEIEKRPCSVERLFIGDAETNTFRVTFKGTNETIIVQLH